jgi:hypothetical protein
VRPAVAGGGDEPLDIPGERLGRRVVEDSDGEPGGGERGAGVDQAGARRPGR